MWSIAEIETTISMSMSSYIDMFTYIYPKYFYFFGFFPFLSFNHLT